MTRARMPLILALAFVAVLSACSGRSKAVGPFPPDPNVPTKQNTHWHAALGVYDCDHWIGDRTGVGIWDWPVATESGSPGQVLSPKVYAGLHSHDDGVIHMEPAVATDAGRNATVGRYFEYGGWALSETGFTFLGTTVRNGDTCAGQPATLHWEVGTWNGDMTDRALQTYTIKRGNPASYKLYQYDIVVLAFLPPSKTLASIGDPPSVHNLGTALGAEGTLPGVAGIPASTP